MRFAADENFNGSLLKALQTTLPEFDVIRVQDTDLGGVSDPELLEWCASQDRILLTHDVQTMVGFAYDRIREGLTFPGVIEVNMTQSIGATVDDLVLLIQASTVDEFINQVRYVPLR